MEEKTANLNDYLILPDKDDKYYKEKIADKFPPKDSLTAIMMAEYVKSTAKENDISEIEILGLIEDFYKTKLSDNLKNINNYREILNFLNKIEAVKNQINRHVDIDSALENLFFQ